MNKTILWTVFVLFGVIGCSERHPLKATAPNKPASVQQMQLKNIHGIEKKGSNFFWCQYCTKITPKVIHANYAKNKSKYPIHTVVYFDFNQSQLTKLAKLKLRKVLTKNTPLNNVHIQIKGYTDSISSLKVNKSLAMHRSLAVKKFIKKIIGNNKTNTVTYQTFAYGKCCYVRMPSNSAINRRVEVTIKKGDK